MKMTRVSHWKIGILNGLFYVLFLGILGMLGYIAQQHQYTADWTFGNRNSLTEQSQQLLESLQQPLEFVAYIPDDPYLQKDLQKRIEKYRRAKSDTSIRFVNPELQPEQAKRDGIQYQGQVVVRLGERQEITESLAESNVANILQRLTRGAERLVVFLEGHEEREPLGAQSSGMADLARVLMSKGFRIQPHNLIRSQRIPEGAAFVVIASPQQDYQPGEADIVREYIRTGGNLLWLHEPGDLKGLSSLEQELGLILHEGTIVDANEQLHAMLGIQHPAVIPVVDYQHSEITKDLKVQTLFPFATAIEREDKEDSDWRYEDFLMTLPTSWLETGEIEGNVAYNEDSGDKPGPLSMGITLQRLLNNGENEPRSQRVAVIGDSDFMLNAFVGHGANMDLSLAIFNWLAQDDQLIDIKQIVAPDTRLELSDRKLYSLGLLFLIVLPLSFLLIGLGIWLRRKKR